MARRSTVSSPCAVLVSLALAASLAAGCSKPGVNTAPSAAQVASLTTVPFVGCAQDGQTGPQAAPSGAPKSVRLDAATAAKLAYYSTGSPGGVLAPRGWYCFGTYGSDGAILFVAPQPIQSSDVLSASWAAGTGPAIQVSFSQGDTSGRFAVATVIERVFPAHQAFAQGVINEGIEPPSAFPSGPWPNDKLTTRSNEVVEFLTPANSAGLGTAQSRLVASGDSISGVAILTGSTPDMVVAAVRLTPDMASLAPVIVQQVEQDYTGGGVAAAPAAAQPVAAPPATVQAATPAADSPALTVVKAFYSALNGGYGGTAATLVVPEKQTGNLSPQALTNFYSSLPQPIRLISAAQNGDGSVSVTYSYTYSNGQTCNGAAQVTTTVRGGQTLISGIHALGKC